jgi:hypothetical protein
MDLNLLQKLQKSRPDHPRPAPVLCTQPYLPVPRTIVVESTASGDTYGSWTTAVQQQQYNSSSTMAAEQQQCNSITAA